MSEAAGQISEPYQSVHSLLSLLLQEASLHFRNLNMISEDARESVMCWSV